MSVIVLVLILTPGVVSSADDLPAQLAGMKDHSWIYIVPRESKRLVPKERNESGAVVEITSRQPAFREYTSPAWGDGKIFYFGGGHSGYPGNDMEIFDPAENIWRQCYRPVCPPKDDSTYYSGGSERSYVDPSTGAAQPFVLHGYARAGFDPGLHRYVCTAMFPSRVERDPSSGKWKPVKQEFCYIGFDAQTNRWERLAAVPDELKAGPTSLSYDPDLRSMVAFNEHAGYVLRDGSWRRLGESKAPLVFSGGTAAVYLPDRKQHLLAVLGHGGANEIGVLAAFSAVEKQGRAGPAFPPELQSRVGAGTGGFNLAMAYDSTHKRVVFMSADEQLRPEVWSYDPAGNAWERLGVGANSPKLVGVFEPGRGRAPLMYDAARNVFYALLRRGEEAELWAWRYRRTEK